jgi:hypothetical protein
MAIVRCRPSLGVSQSVGPSAAAAAAVVRSVADVGTRLKAAASSWALCSRRMTYRPWRGQPAPDGTNGPSAAGDPTRPSTVGNTELGRADPPQGSRRRRSTDRGLLWPCGWPASGGSGCGRQRVQGDDRCDVVARYPVPGRPSRPGPARCRGSVAGRAPGRGPARRSRAATAMPAPVSYYPASDIFPPAPQRWSPHPDSPPRWWRSAVGPSPGSACAAPIPTPAQRRARANAAVIGGAATSAWVALHSSSGRPTARPGAGGA